MSKKLTAHLMSKLSEGVKRLADEGADTEFYISIVNEKEALVRADDDFSLGLAIGMLLGSDDNAQTLVDGLEFKFLSKVEYGKLYELKLDYAPEIEEQIENDLGLNGTYEEPALSES